MKLLEKHLLKTLTSIKGTLSKTSAPERAMNTIVGKNTTIIGKMEIAQSIRIDGTFKGSLTATDTLIVGSTGNLSDVTIKVKNAIIGGNIKGCIIASDRVTLEDTSRVEGDLTARLLTMKEGASFFGNCRSGEYHDLKKQFRRSEIAESSENC